MWQLRGRPLLFRRQRLFGVSDLASAFVRLAIYRFASLTPFFPPFARPFPAAGATFVVGAVEAGAGTVETGGVEKEGVTSSTSVAMPRMYRRPGRKKGLTSCGSTLEPFAPVGGSLLGS